MPATTCGIQALAPSSAKPKISGDSARNAPATVHGQMGRQRQDVCDAELVVGDQALQDDERADDDGRGDGGAADVRESEDPGRGDQKNAGRVVEHAVHTAGNGSSHTVAYPSRVGAADGDIAF